MMRISDRLIAAILEALDRSLAGEPETDDEDREGQELALVALRTEQRKRAHAAMMRGVRTAAGPR